MSHSIEDLWNIDIDETRVKLVKPIIDNRNEEFWANNIDFVWRLKLYNRMKFIPWPIKFHVVKFVRNCVGATI